MTWQRHHKPKKNKGGALFGGSLVGSNMAQVQSMASATSSEVCEGSHVEVASGAYKGVTGFVVELTQGTSAAVVRLEYCLAVPPEQQRHNLRLAPVV